MANWTNLISDPNDLSASSWTPDGVDVLGSYPDQAITDTALSPTQEASPQVSTRIQCGGGSTITLYVHARAGTLPWLHVAFGTADSAARAWFDVSRGIVGNTINCVASIVACDNGVWECRMRGKTSGSESNSEEYSDIIVATASADGAFGYVPIGCGSIQVRDVRAYMA